MSPTNPTSHGVSYAQNPPSRLVCRTDLRPAFALADTVVVKPEVTLAVTKQQSEPGISIDADISIGSPLPDNVTVMAVRTTMITAMSS